MSTDPKLTKLVGFYADPDMQRIIRERAAEITEGNASAYLRRLAVADITAAGARPTGVQPDILERLAELYRPRIAAPLGAAIRAAGTDQPALVERLLLELWESFARGARPEQIHITNDFTAAHPLHSAAAANPVPSPLPPASSPELDARISATKTQLGCAVAAARARPRK
jgi:hypothetical protein